MAFKYPDKPLGNIAATGLDDLPTIYIAQLKLDGWRCVIERTATGLTFTSRHNKPIPIGDELRGEWERLLAAKPVGTILDGEWLARRPGWRQESLYVFDVMHHYQPLWSVSLRERLAILETVLPWERIVPMVSRDYLGF